MKLALLPQEKSKERIVELLREKLSEAEAGNVQGLFMFTEDQNGNRSHCRDGMNDEGIVFAIELIKNRILRGYT